MPESQHTEWKQSWNDKYLEWNCAFANADGGVLQIGKDPRAFRRIFVFDTLFFPAQSTDCRNLFQGRIH